MLTLELITIYFFNRKNSVARQNPSVKKDQDTLALYQIIEAEHRSLFPVKH